jgi:hypothetical protein
MRKQPNGTPGKTPPAPSVKVRPGDFHTLVEILKGRKPRPQRTDSATKTSSVRRRVAVKKAAKQ